MNFDINYPPPDEENEDEWPTLSSPYLQPQPTQQNLQLELESSQPQPQPQLNLQLQLESPQLQPQPQPNLQLELESPQPKPYEFNPFPSQCLPPEPSFSVIPKHLLLTLSPPRSPPPSLEETYSSVLPHHAMPMLHPLDDMHEQELLPPCDLPSQEPNVQYQETGPYRLRPRRLPVRARKQAKTDTITPPYPWATSTRATVHSLDHLLSQNIESIPGTVKCKRCGEQYEIQFDLREKFNEVAGFMIKEKDNMHDRAPESWNKPVLPTCNRCGKENSLEPVFNNVKKKAINWIFLLLGQMIGCCNLGHLKYFCKHNKTHRTAAKDRLIYLTYLGLCKQLSPDGIFDP